MVEDLRHKNRRLLDDLTLLQSQLDASDQNNSTLSAQLEKLEKALKE